MKKNYCVFLYKKFLWVTIGKTLSAISSRKTHLQGEHIFKESTFLREAHFQGQQIFKESTSLNRTHLKEKHIFKDSTSSG